MSYDPPNYAQETLGVLRQIDYTLTDLVTTLQKIHVTLQKHNILIETGQLAQNRSKESGSNRD